MKIINKFFCCISFLILLVFSSTSFAEMSNTNLFYDEDEKIIETIKFDTLDISAKSRSIYSSDISKINFDYEKLKNNLFTYGIEVNKFDDRINVISSQKNDEKYYKIVFNDENIVDVDNNGNILRLKILGEIPNVRLGYNLKRKIISDMENRGYNLVGEGYIDTENLISSMEFQKMVSDNIYNPYESVSVIVDEKNNCLNALNTRDNMFEINTSIISKQSAINILNDGDTEVKSCELVVIKPKDFTIDNDDSSIKLAYRIEKQQKYEFIDANSGDYIGSSGKQAKVGRSFSITTNWNGRYIGNMGHDGLAKLGYSMQPKYISSNFGNQLKDFLKSNGSQKGIFVNCHGNPDVLSDNAGWNLFRSEIYSINETNRKCRFVYFNSCKGAYNTEWAKSLGIIPGQWGAFVGWAIDVDQAKGVLFAERFWRYADGKRPILKAVGLASNDMPASYYMKDGQGIYPDNTTIKISSPLGIRFIGNDTFYGSGK